MTRGNRPFSPRTQAHALRACARAVLLRLGLLAGLGLVLPGPVRAADGPLRDEVEDLADLSLEQLAEIEVMSVSRRLERLSEAAASIYVITAEDIRRAGVVTLPEALRLAPNLQVARADANQYAISARGYNTVLSNNMLVLVDGRTVYSPLFSGVFWDSQDLPLDDIERIEVISGPGGTLWGTNAVNGVINVLTRSAHETHGGLVAGGAGTEGGFGHARFGARGRPRTHWRVHGRWLEVQESERADGADIADAARRWQGGFRADGGDSMSGWMLTGGASQATIDQALRERVVGNVHLLGAWTRRLGPARNLRLQAYFDRNERDQPGAIIEELDTYDVEVHYPFGAFGRHRVFTGAGYRHQVDRVENVGTTLAFIPGGRDLRFYHAFVEDAIHLGDDVDLDLGLKLEHNVYTKWEALPSLRLAYRPQADHLVWTALSRAVRAPSRIDRELFSPAAPPHFVLAGGPDFRSEVAYVAELGYRAQPTPFVSYTITGFVHRSERLRSIQPSPDGPVFGNGFEGTTTGIEAWGRWRITSWWRVDLGLVEQRRTVRLADPAATAETQLGNDPHRWASLRTAFDLFGGHELDVRVRRVGALPNPAVPAYVAVDARLGLRLPKAVELSLTGWNLFDRRHAEWGVAPGRPEFERGVLASLRWRFWGS